MQPTWAARPEPMFEILPLTPELLAELGEEFGGCDFNDPSQTDFLTSTATCDVQAAPGNGKTTLLAAKLALLSRNWSTRRQGVCVISHTNAARTEVEGLIASHPTAGRLTAYPHFTGTVTAFINQYLALPYLRGLGWNVRQVDDDAFAAEALRRSNASVIATRRSTKMTPPRRPTGRRRPAASRSTPADVLDVISDNSPVG